MRARTAQIEPFDRGAILRPARHWPHREQRAGVQIAVEDIAFGQAVDPLQIERGEHHPAEDQVAQVGHVAADLVDDRFRKRLAPLVPGALAQLVGHILDKAREHMMPRRAEAVIDQAGDHAIDPQLFRHITEACGIGTALGALQRRGDGQQRAFERARIGLAADHGRLARKRDVELGCRPAHLDRGDIAAEFLGQIGLGQQRKKRALGIGVREDHAPPHLPTIQQCHARGAAIVDVDAADGCACLDHCAEFARCGGNCAGNRAHAPHHMAVETLHRMVAAREQVEQQPDCRSGLVWPAMLAIDIVRQDHALGGVGLEVTIEEFAEAAGEKLHHLADLGALDTAEAADQAEPLAQPVQTTCSKIRWRFQKERLEVSRERLELAVDFEECLGITRRKAGDFLRGAFGIGPPADDLAVTERHRQDRIARHHAQAVATQIEVPDHRRHQHRGDVGREGDAVPGDHVLGHAGTADNRPRFEHQHRPPGLREIGRRSQPVVTGTDNDCVPELARYVLARHVHAFCRPPTFCFGTG